MKWFKHYGNAHTNRLLQALLSQKNGHELYALYWLLLELLCTEFKKNTTTFILSEAQLLAALRISHGKKLGKFMGVLRESSATVQQNLLECSELSGKFWEIKTHIILDLMGKDFTRTRLSPADAAAKKKEEEERRKNKNINRSNKLIETFDFESIYLKYPRKVGKTKGMKKLQTKIKTQVDYDKLRQAVINYSELSEGKPIEYIKHFSSFVNEWEDYVEINQSEVRHEFDYEIFN